MRNNLQRVYVKVDITQPLEQFENIYRFLFKMMQHEKCHSTDAHPVNKIGMKYVTSQVKRGEGSQPIRNI
jgi:hypothetical protein